MMVRRDAPSTIDTAHSLPGSSTPPHTPGWFSTALSHPVETGEVLVNEVPIRFRSWGAANHVQPGVLLVHGGGAHSRWWDHVGPHLATDRPVTALDLSGHGDSGRRAEYSLDAWADELAAVAAESNLGSHPIVIGHSLGGIVSATLASRRDSSLAGIVLVDSPIEPSGFNSRAEADSPKFRSVQRYPDAATALRHFRPVPEQATVPYIAAHIAEASIRDVGDGWSWKFDPGFIGFAGEPSRTLDGLSCAAIFVAAERGILSTEARRALVDSPHAQFLEVPDAGHAIMLDQPVALIAALRGILAAWARTELTAPI